MKNKIYLLTLLISIGLLINSCDINSEEYQSVSPVDSFVTTSTSVVVAENATEFSFDITVQSSETYTADRSVPISVTSSSTANGLEYTFNGNVDIIAGQLSGSTIIELNTDLLSSDTEKTIILRLLSTSEEITLSYIKECNENKISLIIDFDNFSQETSWEITEDGSGNIMASSGGLYNSGLDLFTDEIVLPNGDYTFTIMDSFGDGICCGWGNGSYQLKKLNCAGGDILVEGASFGSSESMQFSLP
ncbi:MAG: hypothetical protein L3J14_03295 [Flavobacteriaceae bacterium]|nr:hypothetical protein [Flavobacteriaceae bacterium]